MKLMENIVFLLASNKTKILPAPTLPFPHHGKIRTNTYLSCNVILLLNINGPIPYFNNCSGVIPLTNNHFSLFLMQLSALFSVRQYIIFNAAIMFKRDQLTSCQEVPPPLIFIFWSTVNLCCKEMCTNSAFFQMQTQNCLFFQKTLD